MNVKPNCRHGCKFLQVSDGLWLCPHAAYGRASYLKGAIEEGRRLMERAGGYDALLARITERDDEKRAERRRKQKAAGERVRYR